MGDKRDGGRARSREAGGVSRSREGFEMDFRRFGGKKPRVRRGRRAISMAVGCGSRRTQESCFQGGSSGGGFEREGEGVGVSVVDGGAGGEVGVLGSLQVPSPFGMLDSVVLLVKVSFFSSGPGTLRPLTLQASTGKTTVFRT